MIDGIKTYGSDELTRKLQECDDPVFLLTIGTTETSLIDGISGAGPSADLTVLWIQQRLPARSDIRQLSAGY